MFNLVYLFQFLAPGEKALPWTSHTTLKAGEDDMQSMVFVTTEVRVLNVDRVSFESPKVPAPPPPLLRSVHSGLAHGRRRTRWAGVLGCHVSAGCEGH